MVMEQAFIKGMDISTWEELKSLGAVYYDKGEPKELLSILKSYGINAIRLRLWNDPYSEEGVPYGAGTNDLDATIALAKKVKEYGMGLLLDFHYSDFWADPGKQTIPKAWRGYSIEELENAIYDYTKVVLKCLEAEEVFPSMVQVGNELTNGMLWPYGKVPNYQTLTKFVNAGIRGVRAVNKEVPIMLHLDNGGNNELYVRWFDEFMKEGEEFEVIGMSYYPFWHGTLEELSFNMDDMVKRYGKDIVIAETSMGFTLEDYAEYEGLTEKERKGMAAKPELANRVPYPMTEEGQGAFMKELMKRIHAVADGKGKGFYYWEPAWIPVKGSGWASEEALEYMNEKGPGGNEWANQALFDYEGNALLALEVIRED